MKVTLFPYQLRFKYPFRISHGVRSHTDVVFIKIEHNGCVGWGEATLPPYLSETQESVTEFCKAFELTVGSENIDDWVAALATVQTNMSAKAALDMALWSLRAAINKSSIGNLLGIENAESPLCTYTLGVSSFEEMKLKVEEATALGFKILKIKLNGEDDETVVSSFRKLSNCPFAVDVNQGWKTVEETWRKTEWLKSHGCILVEQPLHKNSLSEMKLVKQHSALPLYADESCQRLTDIELLKDCFHGINVKLMKCGGITEAREMILKARQLNLHVLVGCMSESGVGCTAAAHLTPLADYADLDGPYLTSNNPFDGMRIEQGRVQISPLRQVIDF